MFRIASRENIDKDNFEIWGAVFDPTFTKFDNKIEQTLFYSENDIYHWLDSGRGKNRNGDPNKIYSVYKFENYLIDKSLENGIFIYNLRIKKPSETFTTYSAENGDKRNCSFKKLEKKICFNNIIDDIEYSSDLREIDGNYYEGIYPLDVNTDEVDMYYNKYIEYVTRINNMDIHNINKDYSIVYLNSDPTFVKWFETFINKLDYVEKYLDIYAKGTNKYLNKLNDDEQTIIIDKIIKILNDNKKNTIEDMNTQNKIISTIINPQLCNKDIYQIRYKDSLVSWHRNYIYILKKYGLIPSKQFVNMIMNFNFADFFRQIHSKENLLIMLRNIQDFYGLENIRTINNKNSKFNKIVRSFK